MESSSSSTSSTSSDIPQSERRAYYVYVITGIMTRKRFLEIYNNGGFPGKFKDRKADYIEIYYVGSTIQSLDRRFKEHSSYHKQIKEYDELQERKKDPLYVLTEKDKKINEKRKRGNCVSSFLFEYENDLCRFYRRGQSFREHYEVEHGYFRDTDPENRQIASYREQVFMNSFNKYDDCLHTWHIANETNTIQRVLLNTSKAMNDDLFEEWEN